MAKFGNYDQNQAPQSRDEFELMPEGEYLAVITESDVGENSKKTGQVLSLTREIILPAEYKGRKVWQRINVQHESSEAQRIGQIELANVKAAVGFNGVLDDTLRLHNKPHGIKLKIEKGEGKYKDKNVVFDSFPASAAGQAPAPAAGNAGAAGAASSTPAQASAPSASGDAAAPAQAPAAPAGNSAPWLRRA